VLKGGWKAVRTDERDVAQLGHSAAPLRDRRNMVWPQAIFMALTSAMVRRMRESRPDIGPRCESLTDAEPDDEEPGTRCGEKGLAAVDPWQWAGLPGVNLRVISWTSKHDAHSWCFSWHARAAPTRAAETARPARMNAPPGPVLG